MDDGGLKGKHFVSILFRPAEDVEDLVTFLLDTLTIFQNLVTYPSLCIHNYIILLIIYTRILTDFKTCWLYTSHFIPLICSDIVEFKKIDNLRGKCCIVSFLCARNF